MALLEITQSRQITATIRGGEETRHKRGYRTLRVPETVLCRVHRRLRKAS